MPADRGKRWRLRGVVLASGSATMALQMCAVRLLAPWVGSSSLVWATIIGLSLLAMSSGYLLGGIIADRSADGSQLARTLLGAAVLTAVIPAVAPSLLPHITLELRGAVTSSLAGSAVGYLVLFFLPALLLGVTPPYAIRLALASVEVAGSTGGRLYALSTIGSIAGTLLAALVLVQFIGTRATLYTIAVTLVAAALAARGVRAVKGVERQPAHELPAREANAGSNSVEAIPVTSVANVGVLALRVAATIAVVEGMSLMAIEMSVARLVAPFFGASQAVWAVLIAIVMGCIAAGSALGGRVADRRPTVGALIMVLAAAGAAIAVLPFAATPVMRLSTGGIESVSVGIVVGSFLATMMVVVVPMVLLGMVPAWVLRLSVPDVTHSGRTAGRLYACSTVGALVGTGASALWLIPTLGTRHTLLVFALALAALACALAALGRALTRRMLVAPIAALLLGLALLAAPTGLVKPIADGRVLAESESQYQFIQVVQDPSGRRILQLNEGWAIHSIYDPATMLTGQYWDDFLPLPAMLGRPARTMAMVGNAAGTVPRGYRMVHPNIRVDGVDLDPQVTAAGNRYFDMAGKNLRVATADGRPFLRAAGRRRYDIILVDAYRQPYIPFYLTTREFFALVRQHLAPGGVVAINIGSVPGDRRIDRAISATMRAVFPLVVSYRSGAYNEVVVAVSDANVSAAELSTRVAASDIARGKAGAQLSGLNASDRAALPGLFTSFADGLVELGPHPGRVLTDDRAPVEWMTDHMIVTAAEAG